MILGLIVGCSLLMLIGMLGVAWAVITGRVTFEIRR